MIRIRKSVCGVKADKRYGKWTVLGCAFRRGQAKVWYVVCRCDCGRIAVVNAHSLHRDKSHKCHSCQVGEKNLRHGDTGSRLYRVWQNMKRRCYDNKHQDWNDYGGRGIQVCDEWINDFTAFRDWSLKNGYEKSLQIDRMENDGNYHPGNCRWSTTHDQCRNKRSNVWIEFSGKRLCLADWAKCLGISTGTLWNRISVLKWPLERALTTPLRGRTGEVVNGGGHNVVRDTNRTVAL